jgi:hypothetical protein
VGPEGVVSPDGRLSALQGEDGTSIDVVDLESGVAVGAFECRFGGGLAWSPQSGLLFYVGVDERIHAWSRSAVLRGLTLELPDEVLQIVLLPG